MIRKAFISVNFTILSFKNSQFTFKEKPQMKINSLKKQKQAYLIQTRSDQTFRVPL